MAEMNEIPTADGRDSADKPTKTVDVCQLCFGNKKVKEAESGCVVMCPNCDGTGEEPD